MGWRTACRSTFLGALFQLGKVDFPMIAAAMAGLVPAMHGSLDASRKKGVVARDKRGRDDGKALHCRRPRNQK